MGSVRRMSKFDRLPESDTDDDEESEIDPEEEARQRAALKRAQPQATKKLFSGLSSALATDLEPPVSQTSDIAQPEHTEVPNFADFGGGDATSV